MASVYRDLRAFGIVGTMIASIYGGSSLIQNNLWKSFGKLLTSLIMFAKVW